MTPDTSRRWGPAQRPRASSSGSQDGTGTFLRLVDCSTPEGVIVGFTLRGIGLAVRLRGCSTPEGVIVGFTTGPATPRSGPSPAQRPRASSSGSHGWPPAVLVHMSCSTPEGVIVGFTRRPGADGPPPGRLLNARGRHRRVHRSALGYTPRESFCSTPEGVIVGFTPRPCLRGRRPGGLLNARGRHRRVHRRASRESRAIRFCSTPEGVIVGFTPGGVLSAPGIGPAQRPRASSSGSQCHKHQKRRRRQLLNARGRHRRVHILATLATITLVACSTPEGVIVGFTAITPVLTKLAGVWLPAQRPRASSSGSLGDVLVMHAERILLNARGRHRRVHEHVQAPLTVTIDCSTPEGVIVGFTARPRNVRPHQEAAQRPRASSSGSPSAASALRCASAAAQRPRASSSGSRPARRRQGADRHLLNARGRHRRVHAIELADEISEDDCSTPEGVIVGFTSAVPPDAPPVRTAQRPRASSSGSRLTVGALYHVVVCSTPEGVIVGFTSRARGRTAGAGAAQRPRASSSGSRAARGLRRAVPVLLNARGRHRRVHGVAAETLGCRVSCSTPEGVIVGFTSRTGA